MASTKYELLCRYYNVDMKMPITNLAKETWISCFDEVPSNAQSTVKETFKFALNNTGSNEREIQDLLIYGNNSSNPKFNMFFMYNSRDFMYSTSGTNAYPYMLMDKMERVVLSPWFVHSTHASLASVMTKAKALANLIGHENIKIGKVVPLDQYIEII
jgi:hypothetical protein